MRRILTHLVSALLAYPYAISLCATEGASGLAIVEPANGVIVKPGERVRVRVEVRPDLLPGTVFITGGDNNKKLFGSGEMEGPPFEGYVEIPREASGKAEMEAGLFSAESGLKASSDLVTFTIVSDEGPLRIKTQRRFNLDLQPLDAELAELRSRIKVKGYFDGDVERDISGPQFGTTYTSLTPDIVSVASDGTLRAHKPGFGFVVVENAGHRQYSEILVEEANGDWPPPEDKTASFAIQASGFRRDPQTGFFVQQLTLRNTSNVPLPKAIHLLIDDLPEGVELKDTMGSPKAPLTGKLALVKVEGENFLSPGETATATLKFSNREGVPITYSKRVFCGGNP